MVGPASPVLGSRGMRGEVRAFWINALVISLTVMLWLGFIGGVVIGVHEHVVVDGHYV